MYMYMCLHDSINRYSNLRQWIKGLHIMLSLVSISLLLTVLTRSSCNTVFGMGWGEKRRFWTYHPPYHFTMYFLHSCLTGSYFVELFLFKKSYAMNIANFPLKYFLTCTLQVLNKFIDCNRVFVSFLRMDLGLFTGWAAQGVLEQQFVSTWKVMNQMNQNTYLMLRYGDNC